MGDSANFPLRKQRFFTLATLFLAYNFFPLAVSAAAASPLSSSLHEHDELGLCTAPDPLHRVEKRSYLPPMSCTDSHEIEAVRAKVHCQPRPRVVSLPWPNDTSVHQVRRPRLGLENGPSDANRHFWQRLFC